MLAITKRLKLPIPPENEESEEIVLAAMLNDEDGGFRKIFVDRGGDALCFNSPIRREIYQEIEKQNGVIKIVSVKNNLIHSHSSDTAITKLVDLCQKYQDTLPHQIPEHIHVIIQYRKRRMVYTDACKLMDKAFSNNSEWHDVNDWQDPIPFDNYSSLPKFPTEMLGNLGLEIVESVAEVNQVDEGLPASMFLSALSACLS